MGERCTLPASMGGHECEIVNDAGELASVRYGIATDGGARVRVHSTVPRFLLTPVKPPPPPLAEPPNYAVVITGCGFVFRRYDQIDPTNPHRWYLGGDMTSTARSWTEVTAWDGEDTKVTPLVADPFAGEPVELPCPIRSPQEDGTIWIHAAKDGLVNVRIVNADSGDFERVWLGNSELQLLARAVLAAATQAERSQT